MNMPYMSAVAALIFIVCNARCETSVEVPVGNLEKEYGALKGSRCDIYSGCPECVGPLWLPRSGLLVVGKENLEPSILGANICMTLDTVAAKRTGLVHRIKVESSGVLVPQKTAGGGVVSRVIGCDNMYIDAVAEETDSLPDFLRRGIEEFCKPHGKSMEVAACTYLDAYSGRRSIRASFVCEDGWVIVMFGLVREEAVYAVEFLVRDGKLVEAKGSIPVQVSSGTEMKIVSAKDDKCVVGIWNDETDGVFRISFVGEFFSVLPDEMVDSSKIGRLVLDLKRNVGASGEGR